MTPEESQTLTNYRSRILQNIRDGLAPEHGFKQEELSAGLAILRQNRVVAGARGGKASGTAKAAASAEKEAKGAASLSDKLKNLGFNLD